jgi:hypothetical protein
MRFERSAGMCKETAITYFIPTFSQRSDVYNENPIEDYSPLGYGIL